MIHSPSILSVLKTVGRFLAFGFAGWCLENAGRFLLRQSDPSFFADLKPRYSAIFRPYNVPLLPVYGFGGLLITTIAPAIAPLHIAIRAAIYGLSLTTLEYAGCQIDRKLLNSCSWNYDTNRPDCKNRDGTPSDSGCINLGHSVTWAGLALVVEQATKLLAARST